MEMLHLAVGLGILAFFAHIIKGLTGFGPAIVFVSIGSVVYNPVEIIVLAALLDIVGGVYLSYLNPRFFENKDYWIPMGLLMIIGAIIGAVTLSVLPPRLFEYALGVAIILIALWFILGDSEPSEEAKNSQDIGLTDGTVGVFSGFCGGFTGMGGPPLIAYLGSKLEKNMFRAVIVPIFLMAAVARFLSYGVLGMIDVSNILLYIIPPFGATFGNYVGDRFFDRVKQKWFTTLMGIILFLSGLRLMIT